MQTYHTDKKISDETKQPPRKPLNKDVRPREYLKPNEVRKLLDTIKDSGRYSERNYALVLIMYRHALRASEAANLKWENVDLQRAQVHVKRSKQGKDTCHDLERDEIQALKKIAQPSGFVFRSSRQPCLTERAIHRIVAEAGEIAGFSFPIHPHMLRHAKGYQLANSGRDTRSIQDYMGHRSIASTVIYTELAEGRFKGFGRNDLA